MHLRKYDSESVAQLLLIVRDDDIVEYYRYIIFNQVIGEVNELHGGMHLVWC